MIRYDLMIEHGSLLHIGHGMVAELHGANFEHPLHNPDKHTALVETALGLYYQNFTAILTNPKTWEHALAQYQDGHNGQTLSGNGYYFGESENHLNGNGHIEIDREHIA